MRLTVISLLVMAVIVSLLLTAEGKRDKSKNEERLLRREQRRLERNKRIQLRRNNHRHLLPGRGRQHGPPSRRRGPGGRRQNLRNPLRRRQGIVRTLTWDRTVDGITGVRERAILNADKKTVYLVSMNRRLADSNITRSVSFYDFTTPMAAVKARVNSTRVCLILPSSVLTSSFSDVTTTLQNRNGTTNVITPETGSYIMKGSDKMTSAQLKDLRTNHMNLYFFCGSRSIVTIDTTQEVDGSTDTSNTEKLSVLTIGGKTHIYLKSTLSL